MTGQVRKAYLDKSRWYPLRGISPNALIAAAIAATALFTTPAHAESCSKSRDYLLGGLGGELPAPSEAYRNLFKVCLATTAMSNVKDAFLLRDGGIAVIPKQDGISATAAILSRFCDANPRATLRFLSRKDLARTTSIAGIVQMSSTGSTPCREIKGNALR
jgi:hypothetical protein